jgi:glycosyltransferase involved in cell wall biosynthesis
MTSRAPGILVYGMYSLAGPANQAPRVRIRLMTSALSRQVHTEQIVGGRFGRFPRSVKWLLGGGPRRVQAVYVEAPTTNAMPTDLLFLALMRLLRRPVGVYFRDAYQLFRGVHPRARRSMLITDWLWRFTTPLLRGVASRRFVQSPGMGRVLGLEAPVMLPPGTDTSVPDLGAGPADKVAYVGNAGPADGFDNLVAAVGIARRRVPDAGLVYVGPFLPPELLARLPAYVEARRASRDQLGALLADVRACVLPRRVSPYASIVLPVKMWDYLSFGKPIVATSPTGADEVLTRSGAAILTPDTPEGLAEGLLQVLEDRALADRLASNASAFARSGAQTWDARASTVLETLGVLPATRPVGAAE